jgi:hypothetical protein
VGRKQSPEGVGRKQPQDGVAQERLQTVPYDNQMRRNYDEVCN